MLSAEELTMPRDGKSRQFSARVYVPATARVLLMVLCILATLGGATV